MKFIAKLFIMNTIISITTPCLSSETITYNYDLLGRLGQAGSVGTINNNFVVQYTVDDTGNRKRVLVSGSSNQGITGDSVIVVPLNGFTVIPLGQ